MIIKRAHTNKNASEPPTGCLPASHTSWPKLDCNLQEQS